MASSRWPVSRPRPEARGSLLRVAASGLLALAGAGCALGQDAPPPSPAASGAQAVQLETELVRTGLYLIRGGGGNSVLRLSANGMVLVDGKLPGNYRALMAQVRRVSKLSDMPVRVLVLTDAHEEHAGNRGQFMAARIPIVAQREALAQLSLPAGPAAAGGLAAASYDTERTLHLGGVEVQLKHFGRGRTAGDTVVYFPDMKIVVLGELFSDHAPAPDFAAGGSLVDWGPVLGRVLELDFDRVVPGSGPVVGRDALVAFKDKVDVAVARASGLVKAGVGKDALMSRWRTDDLGWRFEFSGDALDRFYAELSR